MADNSCWEILGIPNNSDQKVIKAAFSARSKKCHPEDNMEEFKQLRSAYKQALLLCNNTNINISKEADTIRYNTTNNQDNLNLWIPKPVFGDRAARLSFLLKKLSYFKDYTSLCHSKHAFNMLFVISNEHTGNHAQEDFSDINFVREIVKALEAMPEIPVEIIEYIRHYIFLVDTHKPGWIQLEIQYNAMLLQDRAPLNTTSVVSKRFALKLLFPEIEEKILINSNN